MLKWGTLAFSHRPSFKLYPGRAGLKKVRTWGSSDFLKRPLFPGGGQRRAAGIRSMQGSVFVSPVHIHFFVFGI